MSDDVMDLIDLDEEEILFRLGKTLPQRGVLEAFPTRRTSVARAELWWEENKQLIASSVCASETVQAAYLVVTKKDRALVTAIVDILGSVLFAGPVPLATVAALCIKKGLPSLCGASWPKDVK